MRLPKKAYSNNDFYPGDPGFFKIPSF